MRPIDADKLKEYVHNSIYDDTEIDEIVDAQPTITNFISVIRCENCKNLEDVYSPYCWELQRSVDYSGYCSFGERKS